MAPTLEPDQTKPFHGARSRLTARASKSTPMRRLCSLSLSLVSIVYSETVPERVLMLSVTRRNLRKGSLGGAEEGGGGEGFGLDSGGKGEDQFRVSSSFVATCIFSHISAGLQG